jgi:adenosine deaminase
LLTEETIKSVPKVLLHDHLDGGLRPQTIIELADDLKYKKLPTRDKDALAEWFQIGVDNSDSVEFHRGFAHTTNVLQTKEGLERVAYEMMEDMKSDGVVFIETRFAPSHHINKEMYLEDTVISVLKGLERGKKDFGVGYGLILCGIRNMKNTLDIAEIAVNFRRDGVVGFDLAGYERSSPPKKHLEAFQFIKRANFNITIHAGETFGKESIWQAIQWCGAHRIGHATRLIDDIVLNEEGEVVSFGDLAQYVLDKRIPLEICLLSNLHTGVIDKLENHPFEILFKEKFRVTLNTNHRLMNASTMTREFSTAVNYFDITLDEIEKITINSMKSAFVSYAERLRYIYDVIKPGYQNVRNKSLSSK